MQLVWILFFPVMVHSISPEKDVIREVMFNFQEEQEPHAILGDLNQQLGQSASHDEPMEFIIMSNPDHLQNLFDVDRVTGVVSASKKIDRDTICPGQELCQSKFDVMGQRKSQFILIKVTITILDINDMSPKFPKDVLNLKIPELASLHTKVPIPAAIDLDKPSHGIRKYRLDDESNFDDKFQLSVQGKSRGKFNLLLVLQGRLDREKREMYELKIIAEDTAVPAHRGEMVVHITVLDVNDNPPRFNQSKYQVLIEESWPENTAVVRVHATDLDSGDNGRIAYHIASDAEEGIDKFRIDKSTGEIYVKKRLNFEDGSHYEFSVVAKDLSATPFSALAEVIVNVQDINNNAPKIKINTMTGRRHIARIRENSQSGEFVAMVSVSDADSGINGEFTCSVENRAFTLQRIRGSEWSLVTTEAFDREECPVHNVSLLCIDHGKPPKTSKSVISIEVDDENDNNPEFVGKPYEASLKENNYIGAMVVKVTAKDEDAGENGRIIYRIADNTKELTINPNTGVVSARAVFDYELRKQIHFVVSATDRGTPARTSSTTVTLKVQDANDEPPKFNESSYTFPIKENRPAGTLVGTVLATDGDAAPYNVVKYGLDAVSKDDTFSVEPETGKIWTKKVLDREARDTYILTVTATDTGHLPLSSTANVVIYIQDENDNSPIIEYPNPFNFSTTVPSSIPVGYKITKVQAHDIDAEQNAKLAYELSSNLEDSHFGIDKWTGTIFLQSALDVTTRQREFKGTVIVKDAGYTSMTATAPIRIVFDKTIAYVPRGSQVIESEDQSVLSGHNFWILIAIGSMAGLVILVLIIVLLCLRRKQPELTGFKYWAGLPQMMARPVHPGALERYQASDRSPPARTASISDPGSLNRRRDNFAVVLQQSALSTGSKGDGLNQVRLDPATTKGYRVRGTLDSGMDSFTGLMDEPDRPDMYTYEELSSGEQIWIPSGVLQDTKGDKKCPGYGRSTPRLEVSGPPGSTELQTNKSDDDPAFTSQDTCKQRTSRHLAHLQMAPPGKRTSNLLNTCGSDTSYENVPRGWRPDSGGFECLNA